MPAADAGALTTWRTSPYSQRLYLWIHEPAVVFQARVNMAAVTYPVSQITFDGVAVGAYTDILEGLTVCFGTTQGGDDLGRQRVRRDTSGAVATATVLNIGRSSQGDRDGEVNITDNAWITVLDLRQIHAVHPYITPDGVIYKDGEIAFNATTAQPPVANAGPDVIKLVDGNDEITVDFDGSLTDFKVHPDATSSLTHLWTFPGGTPGTSTSAKPTGVVFTKGTRYVRHRVTDSLGNTHTAYALVAAVSEDELIHRFNILRRPVRPDGQTVTVRIDEMIPYDTYPDGTEVLIFKRERYGASEAALAGPADREHMVFAGWIQQEDNDGQATNRGFIGRSTLTLVDVSGRLQTLPGFPQLVERDDTPESWYQMEGADANRYIHHLLHWHSTALTRADFAWAADGENYPFPTLSSDGQSLYEQADTIAQAFAHKLTCNTRGQLKVNRDPIISRSEDRTSTVIVEIQERDWTAYDYTYIRPPRIHWNWGQAVIASTQNARDVSEIETAFCVAPGSVPGQGLGSANSGQQIVLDQEELNWREGHRYAARQNARYGLKTVELARMGDIGIEPADMEWVRFIITDRTAGPRGRTIDSSIRYLPAQVDFTYNHRSATVKQRVHIEREIEGTPAAFYRPPETDENGLPNIPDIKIVFPDILPPPPSSIWDVALPPGTQRIAFFDTSNFLYRTNNFGPSVVWSKTALAVTGNIQSFVVDAYSPGYRGVSGGAINGWIATTSRIYRIEDIFGTATLIQQFVFSVTANLIARTIDASFGWQNKVVVCSNFTNTNGTRWAYTTDGVNWQEVVIMAAGDISVPFSPGWPGLHISSKVYGLCYTLARRNNTDNTAYFYKSLDWGATWAINTAIFCNALGNRSVVHAPFHDNPNDDLVFLSGRLAAANNYADLTLRRVNVSAPPVVDITPGPGGPVSHQRSFATLGANRQRAAFIERRDGVSADRYLWVTTTGGETAGEWTQVNSIQYIVANRAYDSVALAGDANSPAMYLWGQNYIGYSSDFGLTVQDRVGSVVISGQVVNICGG